MLAPCRQSNVLRHEPSWLYTITSKFSHERELARVRISTSSVDDHRRIDLLVEHRAGAELYEALVRAPKHANVAVDGL